MRKTVMFLAVCCVAATACGERPTQPASVPAPTFDLDGVGTCSTPAQVEALIRAYFPAGQDRSSALSRFRQVVRLYERGDVTTAQAHAFTLVEFILQKYEQGRLLTTDDQILADILNGVLCGAGLAPAFGESTLGDDGAVAFILPTTPDTTVETGNDWAGVHIPAASVTVPTIVTVTRLDDDVPWLNTLLDQYPLYYEFTASPAQPFTQDVLVGVCQRYLSVPEDVVPRLRLGHNINVTGFEILPFADPTFLDCTDAGLAAEPDRHWLQLAAGSLFRAALDVLGQTPAYAAMFATGGVGGTTRNFSPFGAVDTLLYVEPASAVTQVAVPFTDAASPPRVRVRTALGTPVPGVPVSFAIAVGTGTLVGSNPVTDAAGYAGVTKWTFGTGTLTQVHGVPTPPTGTGVSGSPVIFSGVCSTLNGAAC